MNRVWSFAYMAMEHRFMLRVLLILAVMVAMAIAALGPSEIALADGCDGENI